MKWQATKIDTGWVIDSPTKYIADIHESANYDDSAEARAHALLIAAAPEMLNALELINRSLNEKKTEDVCHLTLDCALAMRLAIAKARGEQ